MSHHLNCTTSYLISIAIPCIPDLRNRNLAAVAQYRSCSSSYRPTGRYTNRSASRPCPASPAPSNPQRTRTCLHPFVPGAISSHLDSLCLPFLGPHDTLIPSRVILCLLGPIWAFSTLSETNSERGVFRPCTLCVSGDTATAPLPCQPTQFQPSR
jgi:hypothetical protein